ncbi:MAG: hypothetical protein IPP40_18270 [bacterium]|nr:hypothetical protein [bacterium]
MTLPLPLAGNCGSASGAWYPEDYIIPCSLRVEWQDTLIIMAGSRLLFAPGAGLYVRGALLALGTERDSVIFDRYFELPNSTWGGISFERSSASRFEYSAIRRVVGTSAVTIENARAGYEHCTFSSNLIRMVRALNTKMFHGYAEIQACSVSGNTAGIGGAVQVLNGTT